jgi:hypothetical protein
MQGAIKDEDWRHRITWQIVVERREGIKQTGPQLAQITGHASRAAPKRTPLWF